MQYVRPTLRADPCCVTLVNAAIPTEDALALSTVLAALLNPIRLRLFSVAATEGEVCSCSLEGPPKRSQPTISHHTRIFAEAGLLVGEKRGKWVWRKVVPERLELLQQLVTYA